MTDDPYEDKERDIREDESFRTAQHDLAHAIVERDAALARERDLRAAVAAHPEPDATCPERIDDGMRDYACAKAAGHADDCGAPAPPALTVTREDAEARAVEALREAGVEPSGYRERKIALTAFNAALGVNVVDAPEVDRG